MGIGRHGGAAAHDVEFSAILEQPHVVEQHVNVVSDRRRAHAGARRGAQAAQRSVEALVEGCITAHAGVQGRRVGQQARQVLVEH